MLTLCQPTGSKLATSAACCALRVARAAVQAAKDCDVLADSYQSKHCPFTVGDVANDLREALRSEED
jgi:hypothetical protein